VEFFGQMPAREIAGAIPVPSEHHVVFVHLCSLSHIPVNSQLPRQLFFSVFCNLFIFNDLHIHFKLPQGEGTAIARANYRLGLRARVAAGAFWPLGRCDGQGQREGCGCWRTRRPALIDSKKEANFSVRGGKGVRLRGRPSP
jgi:hypothetical protein